jgi:hypothetical protein
MVSRQPTIVVIDPPAGASAGTDEPAADQALAAFDRLYIRHPRRWLIAMLGAYVVAALLFAYLTPAWQAPDEPAHYNYVAHIAQTGTLPVLRSGDYDHALLNRLLNSRFAPPATTEALRYEAHQPPLYYLLATPVFWLSGGSLRALRLFGILIGAGGIVLLYLCLELVFPGKPLVVVGGTAFSALLPMHVAVSAAVNNDGMAELLIMAAMLALLGWLRGHFYDEPAGEGQPLKARRGRRRLLLLGVLLGLGMLTKVYAYVLAPIAVLAVAGVAGLRSPTHAAGGARQVWRNGRRGAQQALWVAFPALIMALPWWVRNWSLYGAWDVLGLAQHDRIVAGQPRTAEWIAHNGWLSYSERAFSFTFKSFWGVFGWMGVFLDDRIYTALLLFSGVIFLGLLWATVRFISGPPDTDMDSFQIFVLVLFGVMLLAVTASYAWYNVQFVQHQGRYFFWGLLPISAIVALGWREVLQPLQGVITGMLALVLTAGIAVTGSAAGTLDKWSLLSTGLITLMLLLQPLLLASTSRYMMGWLPASLRGWLQRPRVCALLGGMRAFVWATPFLLLIVLNIAVPIVYIVPQLGR